MNILIRLALKNARINASRFVLTMVAIIISVAFLTATLVLSDSMSGTASADIAEANAQVHAVVQGGLIAEGGGGPGEIEPDLRLSLTDAEVSAVSSTPGVASVALVNVGFAKVVADGTSVGSGVASDIGMAWTSDPDLNPFAIATGEAPATAKEVALDKALAAAGDIQIGDTVQVLTSTGVHNVIVSGLTTFGGNDSAPAQRVTSFAPQAAADLLGSGDPSELRVRFDSQADASQVIAQMSSALRGTESQVLSGSDYIISQQDSVTAPMSFLSVFLLAFAAIATVVGTSIIYNTFVIAMARRRREFALLRAIGAERRQVLRSVLVEAVLIGLVATTIGIAVGIGSVGLIRSLMTSLGLSFLSGPTVVTSTTLMVAAVVGILVTTASSWIPARAAAATPPIAALSASAIESLSTRLSRTLAGYSSLLLGCIGLVLAVASSSSILLLSLILLIVGLVLAGPDLVAHLADGARPILKRTSGIQGDLAATNLRRNPKRASSTTLSLSLGVALVSFFTIIASSFGASITNGLDDTVTANWVVNSVSPDFASVDPRLSDRLADIDGVGAVAALAQADALVNGTEQTVGGIDPNTMPDMFDFELISGDLSGLAAGGVAVTFDAELVPDAEVTVHDIAVGDIVEVQFEETLVQLPVVAIVTNSLGGFDSPTLFVSAERLEAGSPGLLDTSVFVSLAEGANEAATGEQIREVVELTAGSLYETRQSYVDNAGNEIDSFRNFIYALLSLTVVIALVGVANTTVLSISERVREIGLLRAVGMTGDGVRKVIVYETALLTVAGTSAGTALALLGSWALISVSGGTEMPSVIVPWASLAIIAFGSIAAGLMTAVVPALSASRKPVLVALAGH